MLGRKRVWDVEGVEDEVRRKLEERSEEDIMNLVEEVRGIWTPKTMGNASH